MQWLDLDQISRPATKRLSHLVPDQVTALPAASVDDALLRDVDRLRDRTTFSINPDLQVCLKQFFSQKDITSSSSPSRLSLLVASGLGILSTQGGWQMLARHPPPPRSPPWSAPACCPAPLSRTRRRRPAAATSRPPRSAPCPPGSSHPEHLWQSWWTTVISVRHLYQGLGFLQKSFCRESLWFCPEQ